MTADEPQYADIRDGVAREIPESSHEVRELKFRLKQQRQQNGRQGQTIHRLRAELAEVRALNSKIERGELRHLERLLVGRDGQLQALGTRYLALNDEVKELRRKLQAAEGDPLWAAQHEGETV